MQTQIVDLNNTVKVMSAPPAPPPPDRRRVCRVDRRPTAMARQLRRRECLPRQFTRARCATAAAGISISPSQGFREYLRYYGNTELAPNAQFYIGQIHYDKNEFAPALQAFDTVLEKYPENNKTADATYMKGMALLKSGQRNEAAREFLNVITKYPNSEVAAKARTQRKALGLSVPTAQPASAKRRR